MTNIFKLIEKKMEKILKMEDKHAKFLWVGDGKDPFKK